MRVNVPRIIVRQSIFHRAMAGLALLSGLVAPVPVEGHTFERTVTVLRVDRARNFEVTLRIDLDALALGVDARTDPDLVARALLDMSEPDFRRAAEGLENLLSRRLRVRADGRPLPFAVSFPQHRPRPLRDGTEVFGLEARLTGRVPAEASEIQFFASRAFPAIELSFVDEAAGRREFHICLPGEECPVIELGGGAANPVGFRFLALGFRHIVPLGLDHILFVLALFLGGRDPKTLLIQTGLFTLAHSATLALSTFGVVSLSPRIVEPLIALSIAVVGLENLIRPSGVSKRRAVVVFMFGLLHGLGFAGALAETPLAQGPKLLALLLFNLGVELGQIAVLIAAWIASLPVQDPIAYRRRIERPLSMALFVIGLIWALMRLAS